MSILGNAISGLQASQTALRTAGHNISNANTEGYSRQRVDYVARTPQSAGVGYLGSGVLVSSVERIVSEYLIGQLRTDINNFEELNTFNDQIGNIDKLLADSGTGLAEGLQTFFASLQSGADDPSSTPARQLIIAQSESLTARFNLLYGRMESINNGIASESRVIISEINSLARSIGELNLTIQQQLALGQGAQPNDLLDQRDEALKRLSELVTIQVIEQDAGDVNVMIGSGQPLVVGQAVSQFTLTNGNEIVLSNAIGTVDVTDAISGGQLGGLVRFREELLDPAFNELGRVALVMSEVFNDIQQQGLDLDGDFGTPFFTDINDAVVMTSRVTGAGTNQPPNDRSIYVEIADTGSLTIDDYTLRLIPNTQNYIVTRNADGSEVTQGILSGAYPAEIAFEGLVVHLESGSFQGGDEFLIQPTRRGAVDIESLIERPEDIAFALPIRTQTGDGNIGAGRISAGEILSIVDQQGNVLPTFSAPGQLSPPVVVVFTSPTTYDVLDNSDPGKPVDLVPPLRNQSFIPNQDNALFSTDPGVTIVTGTGSSMGLPPGRISNLQAAGGSAVPNGYPVEQLTFTTTNPTTGATTTQSLTTTFNSSAGNTASLLSNLDGVSANAFTEAVITDININNLTSPVQIRLSGQDLIGYSTGQVASDVPDPSVDEAAFNTYLAERINENQILRSQGIYATSTSDPITGNPELRILASTGIDLDIRIEGVAGDNISVNDGVNPNVRLTAAGGGQESLVTVGGRIDLTLADNVVLTTAPSVSQFFGDSSAADFAQSAFMGYQAVVSGQPSVDDRFHIQFNDNASVDNRNALRFVDLETEQVVEQGTLTLSESYGQLVERVGTESNLSQINTEAAELLLRETQATRDAISAVNLDEEAANLVRFEQVYNANARVIAISRDTFDTLLNSF
ncbi:flagellar hook-associated protein FlgK [Aurantivibrio plasticivorans]